KKGISKKKTMEKTRIVFLTILIMENLLLAVGLTIYLYRNCQKCQKVKEIDRGEALELLTTITDKSVSLIFLDPQYEKVGDVSRYEAKTILVLVVISEIKESLLFYSKRTPPIAESSPTGLFRTSGKKEVSLVEATTQEGDLIVDPCAGSFIVLKACRETNRNFLGVDLTFNSFQFLKAKPPFL
ncbi:15993_t:CDS:2, partial [Racocetra persica]